MITILAMYTKDCEDLILTGLEKDEEMRYTGVELYEPSGKKFDITEYFDVEEYEHPMDALRSAVYENLDRYKKFKL